MSSGRVMLAWILTSASVCGVCGIFGFGTVTPIPQTVQSFLFLIMALAATVLLGAFDAYEGQDRSHDNLEDA